MKTILDLGKKGGETINEEPILHGMRQNDAHLLRDIEIVQRFPAMTIDVESSEGVKGSVEVHALALGNSRAFDFITQLATHAPMVYVRAQGRSAMGMLSPNYDTNGEFPLPSLKVIPLRQAYPLTNKRLPDPVMATMLAGGVAAESKGVGGHGIPPEVDFEHKATILGSVSVGDPDIATNHANHAVRKKSSLVTGLTNGSLGTLYQPDRAVSEFTGFGEPLLIEKSAATRQDFIYIPKSFLDAPEQAFGVYFDEAPRILLGAGLQVLYERTAPSEVNNQIRRIGARV